MADCVILLDHRVDGADRHPAAADRQVSRLDARHERVSVPDRRGAASRSCRSPRWGLKHEAANRARSPAGIPRLDAMLGGKGYYRGSSVLVSGTAGTGKTSLAAHFAQAAARAASGACISPSRNRPARSSATCAPSASTWNRGCKQGAAAVSRRAAHDLRPGDAPGDHPQAGRASSSRGSSSLTRSPTSITLGTRAGSQGDADAAD